MALRPVSASFNPGRDPGRASSRAHRQDREAVVLTSAPVVGGLLGTVLANLMFHLDAVSLSTHDRYGASLWLGEFVATL